MKKALAEMRKGKLGVPRQFTGIFTIRLSAVLFAAMSVIMLVGSSYTILADRILPMSADATRTSIAFLMQIVDETMGFPLPTNYMVNESLSAIGFSTLLVGLDLLVLSISIRAKNKPTWWSALLILALAIFFDFVAFLYQGVIGAPMSVPGMAINALTANILIKNRPI
jgi:uncharacterized protein YhhL (DUF1145 family)